MKPNSIINRYLLAEMLPPFVINLVFFTFVFLMTRILEITHLIVNFKVPPGAVLLLLVYSMPFFLQFILPMSVMMAVLLTFLRLSGDNEITALKAGGVGVYQLLPPVLIFSLCGGLLTAGMTFFGLPQGRLAFKNTAYEIARSHLDIGLKARTFNDAFRGVMLYVNEVDKTTHALKNVFIEDRRTRGAVTTVVAPRGRLISQPAKLAVRLRLYDGTINQATAEERTAHTVYFDTYDLSLRLNRTRTIDRDGPKDEEEMTLAELRAYLRDPPARDDKYYLALMEFHKKFALPFACLALGVLAVPLGVRSKSARRAFGVGLGLAFFLGYYLLLSVGWVFGEAGLYPPLAGMWVPNLVTGAAGVFLLRRCAREEALGELLRWPRRRRRPAHKTGRGPRQVP